MAKKSLATGKLTFNSVEYGVVSLDFNEAFGEIDVTDTSTTGDGKEYLGGRVDRTFSVELWMDVNAPDIAMNSPQAGELDFEGKTYAGTMIFLTRNSNGAIDAGIKQTYTGRFNGSVTTTPAA